MKKEDTSFHAGHRQRLRQKFRNEQITDYELLELLISFVIPRRDVRPIARGLMQKYGGLFQIVSAPEDALVACDGIGQNTAIFFKALQSAMLSGYRGQMAERQIFHDPRTLYNYCRLVLGGKNHEEVHILYLDAQDRLLEDECHSVGTNTWSAVYPREILRRALNLDARKIIMVHNHPTPNMSFSKDDKAITDEVMVVLAPMGIIVRDHLLVSGDQLYSMRNNLILDTGNEV